MFEYEPMGKKSNKEELVIAQDILEKKKPLGHVAQQEFKQQEIVQQIDQLRRAYTDLWYRQSASENRLTLQEKKTQQIEEDWFEEALVINEPESTELLVVNNRKLPANYSDKSFPYISLPLVHILLYFRKLYRKISTLVILPEISVEGTRKAIVRANEERQLINILKIQRRIHKVQRALMKAIRKNFDSMIEGIGPETNDNILIAQVLKLHFEKVGYSNVKITTNQNQIYIMIEIEY